MLLHIPVNGQNSLQCCLCVNVTQTDRSIKKKDLARDYMKDYIKIIDTYKGFLKCFSLL